MKIPRGWRKLTPKHIKHSRDRYWSETRERWIETQGIGTAVGEWMTYIRRKRVK